MNEIKQIVTSLAAIDEAIETERIRHREQMDTYNAQIDTVRKTCGHLIVERLGDPAGGPASYYCHICDKELSGHKLPENQCYV